MLLHLVFQFGDSGQSTVETFVSFLCDSMDIKRPFHLLLTKPVQYKEKTSTQTLNFSRYESIAQEGKYQDYSS